MNASDAPVLLQHILSEPEEIVTMGGQKLPLKCSVDYISFSAHTDYKQTSEFVRTLKPAHIVSPPSEFVRTLKPAHIVSPPSEFVRTLKPAHIVSRPASSCALSSPPT